MKTRVLSMLILLIICMGVNAQNVNIPDTNFKSYLVNNHTINTNQDTEIQESEAIAFAGTMFCDNRSISDLTGIEAFPNIIELFCHDNNLTTINVSNNTALRYLDVSGNSLSSIDVSAIVGLRQFDVSDNPMSSLDVSSNTALISLYCYNDNLTSLDLSNNTALIELSCGNNALTALDVTANSTLYDIYCQDNALTSLKVANGVNSPYGRLNALNNPDLTCIEVDDVAWSTANWTSIDATASFSASCVATPCTVNIPDANFKTYLVGNAAINTDGDTEISCAEATAFTGTIYVYNLSISDLTGIEAFVNITELNAAYNELTSIDVSNSTALTKLDVGYNDLVSLDVSTNIALTELYCRTNYGFTSLDVSNNTALTVLSCFQNNLTSLDVSANAALTFLSCSTNNLTSLDVSANPLLTELFCDENALTTLNVSGATALLKLYCEENSIESLDLSTNTALTYLSCSETSLTSMDLSANTDLLTLYAHNNTSLTSLNVANGNNSNFNYFYAAGNPSLSCIQVDDVAWSDANWSAGKDAAASFSTNCTPCIVNIPDTSFKTYLVGNTAINTDGDTEISCSEATAFNGTIDCSNLSIADLTGIEAFTSLTKLYSHTNQLTSLDVSDITTLNYLTCYSNQITSLDLSNNTALTYLNYSENQITSLDLSNNTALEYLFCNDNQITSLDLSNNTALVKLSCTTNQLTSLDVSVNTALEDLNCSVNQLSSLDLSNNTALTKIYCVDNQITGLDLSAHTVLESLFCNGNELTSLNIANTNNANMLHMFASDNEDLDCIQVDDVAYSTTNWTDIDPTASFSINCSTLSVGDYILNDVSLYPNPTTSVLNIKMDSNLKRATIYSTLGAVVLETTSKTIATANLKSGFYLIRIEDENGNIATNRFIKK